MRFCVMNLNLPIVSVLPPIFDIYFSSSGYNKFQFSGIKNAH